MTSCSNYNVESNKISNTNTPIDNEVNEYGPIDIKSKSEEYDVYKTSLFYNDIELIPNQSSYAGILFDENRYSDLEELENNIVEHSQYMFKISIYDDLYKINDIMLQSISTQSIPILSIQLGSNYAENINYIENLLDLTIKYNYPVFFEIIYDVELFNEEEILKIYKLIKSNDKNYTILNFGSMEDVLFKNINYTELVDWISLDMKINELEDIKILNDILQLISIENHSVPILLKLYIANYDKTSFSHIENMAKESIDIIYNNIKVFYPMVKSIVYMDKPFENNDTYDYRLNSQELIIVYKLAIEENDYIKTKKNIEYMTYNDKIISKLNIKAYKLHNKYYIEDKYVDYFNINNNNDDYIIYDDKTFIEIIPLEEKNKSIYV